MCNSYVPSKNFITKLALFSSENFLNFGIIAFSFLFDKYYPIMD